jgi:HEAT repeat protein
MTAEEWMAELEANPDFVAHRDERERERQRNEAKWRQAETPLVEELRGAGLDVEWSWDLVNTSKPYPEALPILLEHLQRSYPDRVREGIARALAVRDAQFAWPTLTRLYREEDAGTNAKDGLAVAIAATSHDEVIDELISLAGDTQHGESRLLLLRALKRSRNPRARTALEELEADPELEKEVRRLLRRRGQPKR